MTTYLLFIALAPAVILMIYVWNKDKSKEPFKMLLILAFLGAVSCFPAGFLESPANSAIMSVFGKDNYLSYFLQAFFGVALMEEGCKFIVMFLYTRNHKEFNGLFDGMIYAVLVSLGFAAFENVFYVMDFGSKVALSRAFTAIPGHMFNAVFMGYNYSLWHTYRLCDKSEKYFANLGMIRPRLPKYKYKNYLAKAIIIPVLVHGFYDFCLFTSNTYFYLIFYVFVGALYIICFGKIKKLSKRDMEDYQLIPRMLCLKYPELMGIIIPHEANPIRTPNTHYQNRQTLYK